MENYKKVTIEFTGGFDPGDHELIKEGFVIGRSYQGIMTPCERKVWVNNAIFYVDENCKLV